MSTAGSAYVVAPGRGAGPGVLVLHAWWGLTPFFKRVCDRLADEGFVAMAPDLFGGVTAETPDEAERLLRDSDPNVGARLVLASAATLRNLPVTPDGPIGVVGFSMGASWGLWLSARSADSVAAAVAFYGSQDIDFAGARAAYLCHFAEQDSFVSDDEIAFLEASLRLEGLDVDVRRYPGTTHWFFEEDREVAYQPEAADVAWRATVEFLRSRL